MTTQRSHGTAATVATGEPPARLSKYLWLVLASAFLAWMFDSIALNAFNLILTPSMSELLHTHSNAAIAGTGGLVVAVKLVAWGIGGTLFGVLTDRYGRARIMLVTILIYTVFTGLSATAQNWEQLALFQGLAGLGIGGEWSAGAALLAESLPERLRPRLMIIMQLAFSVGYFIAAVINLATRSNWRLVLVWCAVPAIVVIVLRLLVREPERWVNTSKVEGTRQMGSLRRLFEPDLRRRTLGGLFSAMTLMVGSFAATTFSPSWIAELLGPSGAAHTPSYVSYFAMLLNGGAAVGYILLIWMTQSLGRRPSYFIFALGSLLTAIAMFTMVHSADGVLIAAPFAGFFMLGGFGVFAVYLPELFPTEVRATGQGLCFNFARIITGAGTLLTGVLVGTLGSYPLAGVLVSVSFAVGLFTIWIGPETKGWRLSDA
jgi:MFS family permease